MIVASEGRVKTVRYTSERVYIPVKPHLLFKSPILKQEKKNVSLVAWECVNWEELYVAPESNNLMSVNIWSGHCD